MKTQSIILTLTFISVLVLPLSLFAILQAEGANGYGSWSPIDTIGYAIITNYFGTNVPLGQSVVATAGTTDLSVYKIEFVWHNGTGAVIFDENVTVSGPLTTPTHPSDVPVQVINWSDDNPGIQYLYAQNTQIPDSPGDWGVQAYFYAPGGRIQGEGSDIIAIRSTSFNYIDEVPIIGTAGAAIAMLLGLGLYRKRKQK